MKRVYYLLPKYHASNETYPSIQFQHDQNYGSYKIQNYIDSLPSPEDFFIRKFNDDTEISSILMRKEEKRIVENLFASPIEHKSGNVHQFKINEYLTLCRGKLLVGISMI